MTKETKAQLIGRLADAGDRLSACKSQLQQAEGKLLEQSGMINRVEREVERLRSQRSGTESVLLAIRVAVEAEVIRLGEQIEPLFKWVAGEQEPCFKRSATAAVHSPVGIE